MFSMNFFQFKSDFRRRRFKMFFLFILLLLIFLFPYTYPYSQEKSLEEIILSEGTLTDEQFFGEYTYRHFTGPPHRENIFQIYKKEELVYQSKVGYAYWLSKENELFSPGDDITGDGIPNLVVLEDSGGSFFPTSCHVFSLGEQFRLIQSLPGGDFKDLNQDGKLDYTTYEIGFSSWHASHADSPAPKLVYEYCDNKYLLAPALMYKPIPSEDEITQAIIRLKKDITACEKEECLYPAHCWYYEGTYIPPSVWGYILDFLYSGHPLEARQFLDKVWPEAKPGKELFLFDFKQRLNRSDYWRKIRDDIYKSPEEKEMWTIEVEEKPEGYGQIKITSTPEGASIYLDDVNKGETPLTLSEISLGEHKLKLDSSGYEDWEENIVVSSIQVKEVDVELVAKTGDAMVKVWPIPKEAEIFLDGVYMGKGYLNLGKVSPGEHRLKVTKVGYQDWQNTFSFYPGETHIVLADLKDKTNQTPLLVLIGLVIFTFVVFYYGLKREKNKKA